MQLWVFFGQVGAGKSFVARVCAEELGFEQYDGDRDLTPEMQLAIRESRLFTTEMRAKFVTLLSDGIRKRCIQAARSQRSSLGLAVCQGLFKIRDRNQLQANFPKARLVWVRASDELIEARLRQRAGHVASSEYARLVNGGFETPAPNSDVLENDGDRARIVEQLRRYLH